MDILKLMIVFGVLVVMLWLKRPLYQGILGAAAAVCILFGIAPAEAFKAYSIRLPRYMTPTSDEIWRTMDKSWEMNR